MIPKITEGNLEQFDDDLLSMSTTMRWQSTATPWLTGATSARTASNLTTIC